MKNKGFTLVELLSVIILLTIVSIVTVPVITGMLQENSRKALEDSVEGLIKGAKLYSSSNLSTEYMTFDLSKEETRKALDVKGTMPEEGTLIINEKGEVYIYAKKGNYCAYKEFDDKKITVSTECNKTNSQIMEEQYLSKANTLLSNLQSKVNSNTQEGVYFFDSNHDLDYGKDNIKIKQNIDSSVKGNISVWNGQIIYACFNYKDSNYEYDLKTKKINKREMPCLTNRYDNLVINGDLSFKSNLNLTEFGEYNGDGYLMKDASPWGDIKSTDIIPVDPNKKYEIEFNAKDSNGEAKYYVGCVEYDVSKNQISPNSVMYISDTLTELTEDLKQNDTVVHLKDLTNWNENLTNKYQRGFIIWNYEDSTGYKYQPLTYSRIISTNLYTDSSSINKGEKTITLTSPWASSTISKGTKISQSNDGNTYNYSVRQNSNLSTDFNSYKSNIISGINTSSYISNYSFRAGTKYIKFVVLMNTNSIPNTTLYIKNISIKEVKD